MKSIFSTYTRRPALKIIQHHQRHISFTPSSNYHSSFYMKNVPIRRQQQQLQLQLQQFRYSPFQQKQQQKQQHSFHQQSFLQQSQQRQRYFSTTESQSTTTTTSSSSLSSKTSTTKIDSPIQTTIQNMSDLKLLAEELNITENGKPIKIVPKKSKWYRLFQLLLFTGGFTAALVSSFVYQYVIISRYYKTVMAYRLWRDNFYHVLEYANNDHIEQDIPVQFISEGDVDTNILALQKVWFHRTFIMSNIVTQIQNQIDQIAKTFSQCESTLAQVGNAMLKAHTLDETKKQDHSDNDHGDDAVRTFALLAQDIQSILDNAYMTQNELDQFRVILAQADCSFAIDTHKWNYQTANQDKITFFEQLDLSVHDSMIWIDRLQELLATSFAQTQHFRKLMEFVSNGQNGYIEYRNAVIQQDEQHRQEYANAVSAIEDQLQKIHDERQSLQEVQNNDIPLQQPTPIEQSQEQQQSNTFNDQVNNV